jgi:AcrR family transcriptional regulator
MIGTVADRRAAKVATIVAAAWELAGTDGLGGLSLRALAREVGMRQPSLYEYFDSKNGLFDAMFADGNRQLMARLDALDLPEDPRRAVKACLRGLAEFALEDPTRHQLLFQRPIPSFEPSAASYALAEGVLNHVVERLRAVGLEDPADIDCVVAMVAGLVDAQVSNDPGGDRWVRHLDRMIDLHLDDAERRGAP